VKCIFTAAGGVGVGAINEAIARAKQGKQVWIVGVDVDQFDQGIYDTTNNKSVIITSAMKGVTQATYDMIKDDINGKFPGGQTLHYSAANGGVGIPDSNPNLSADVMTKVQQVEADLKAGKITVAAEQGSLIK
jgi:basic membrane protein A